MTERGDARKKYNRDKKEREKEIKKARKEGSKKRKEEIYAEIPAHFTHAPACQGGPTTLPGTAVSRRDPRERDL